LELINIVEELQRSTFDDDSIIRVIAKQYFGNDSIVQILAVSNLLLPIVTERMKHYSPYIIK
jgi:hypothetical protein